ncbi:MAG: TrkA C-terminal domain-containing protein, partial [Phycisphaerae bacterium]|nr:TrkA C-terminal domain-containing protein [Phycisphaerae bacterium]
MIPLITLVIALLLSMLVVRVGTVALTLTGLSRESARFQARSAFTGAGFTTSESEKVVHHPVRRRIIMLLMLLGNAGIVTVISTMVLSMASTVGDEQTAMVQILRIALMLGCVIGLWYLAHSHWVDRWLSRWIKKALARWTDLDVRDYHGLFHLGRDYSVSEMLVQPDSWLSGHDLMDLQLSEEGVLVLGIERVDGTYFGAPRGQTRLEPGDTVILYGRDGVLADLDDRRQGLEGNTAHVRAVKEHVRAAEAEEVEAAAAGAEGESADSGSTGSSGDSTD